jgi:2-polyprenyl-6-methoxyphenol hydroxylase-like FAD-dependent oxidoreductase
MQATEVSVIGGGPAGLAVALAARRRGLEVMLADAARPPIDKACGEGLMPDGLAALGELGVSLSSADAQPFHGIRFVGSAASVEAAFPVGSGIGVRRTALHARMVAAAETAGVRMCWGTPVSGLTGNTIRLAGTTVAARWIIGADGFNSRVRRWAGLEAGSAGGLRFGFRIHYRREPWTNYMELHWGHGCQIYVTPVSPSEVCVALVSRDPHLRLEQALQGFRAFARDWRMRRTPP